MRTRVGGRKRGSPAGRGITTTSANTSLPVKIGRPTESFHLRLCHGVVTTGIADALNPSQTGRKNPGTARVWATAIVTTVRISRGDRLKRLITTRSTTKPAQRDPRHPVVQGHLERELDDHDKRGEHERAAERASSGLVGHRHLPGPVRPVVGTGGPSATAG